MEVTYNGSGERRYAMYERFLLDGERSKYKLNVAGYSGTQLMITGAIMTRWRSDHETRTMMNTVAPPVDRMRKVVIGTGRAIGYILLVHTKLQDFDCKIREALLIKSEKPTLNQHMFKNGSTFIIKYVFK